MRPTDSHLQPSADSFGGILTKARQQLGHVALLVRLLGLQVLSVILGIPTGIIAARFLGPELRGQLAIFVAGSFMFSTLVAVCTHESLPYLVHDKKNPAHAVGTAFVLQVAGGTMAAALSLLAPQLPFMPVSAARVLQGFQPMFAAACVAYAANHAISMGVLARSGAGPHLSIELARQCTYLIFMLVFVAALHLGLEGAVSAFLLALVVQITTAVVLLRRTTRCLRWNADLMSAELRYGLRALPGRIADYFFSRGGDVLVISAASGAAAAGYYIVARSVTDLTLLPAVSAGLVIQSDQKGPDGVPLRPRQLLVAAAGLMIAGVGVLAFVGPFLIELVFGSAFESSGGLLRILLVAAPAMLFTRVLAAQNARSGVPQRNSWAATCAALIFAPGAVVAGRAFGVYAAVGVFVASVWLQMGILLALHWRASIK